MERENYLPEMWIDSQVLVNGRTLVWYYDQEMDLIRTILLS
jgi:hypothetical protein